MLRIGKTAWKGRPTYNPRMLFDSITIVGVGLIGGSVGLAARARGAAGHVVGVGRNPRTLSHAVELGAIDSFSTDLLDGVKTADLVVVCTPVDRIADAIRRAGAVCRPGTIFTDAGSTKRNIVEGVAGLLPAGASYVPAHPLAGAEKNGVEHARADLFEGRVTILTPDARVCDDQTARRVGDFWRALGSRLEWQSIEDHDRTLAMTSHLPHAVSAAVASVTPRDLLPLSAGGFRDVTRIAAGSPELWSAIFTANRAEVLRALERFSGRLDEFRHLLESGDGAGLVRWLTEAKQVRDALGS
jgi:cyclohexadieny/prephenate dehydrogenase